MYISPNSPPAGLPFYPFRRPRRFISSITPPPSGPTGFTIPGFRIYKLYAVSRRAYHLYNFTILLILSPSAGSLRQLARLEMRLMVHRFTILPILGPIRGYTANYPAARWPYLFPQYLAAAFTYSTP